MKNLRKAELAVLGATLLILVFTAGYFTGRYSGTRVVRFDPISSSQASDDAGAAAEEASSGKINTSGGGISLAAPSSSAAVSVSASPAAGSAGQPSLGPTDSAQASEPAEPAPGKLNLNTASFAELVALPGIGDKLAQSIIDYRRQIGGFQSIAQIMDVSGIGEKKFEAIKDMITV